jgi:uncharacterized protein (TIGR04222 family)
MSDHTWGIPGPLFLLLFLGAGGVLLTVALTWRARRLGGPTDPRPAALHPQRVAYLAGGAPRAVYASLASLRAAGAVAADPIGAAAQRSGVVSATVGRTLTAAAGPPAGATALDTAVHAAAGRHVLARLLGQDSMVRAAVDDLHAGLERDGLLATDEARRAARWAAAPLLALAALGLARLVAGLAADRPVGVLAVAELAVAVAATVLLAWVPRTTRAGRRALAELRSYNTHLSPKLRPSMGTYGAAGAGLAVALYGVAGLWAMDPGFAADAEVERVDGGTPSGYTGDGGGSDGGGSDGGGGCGGGGCGCGGCGG